MIGDLAASLAEGFAAPRQSMRRVLALGPQSLDVIVAMVLASYLVQTLALVALGSRDGSGGIGEHVLGLLLEATVFMVIVALVWRVGKLFGGTGELGECAVAVGWFSFVTAFLSPLVLAGLTFAGDGEGTAASTVLFLAAAVITLWVFAGVVAEVHGFRSTGAVLAAILMVGVAVTLVIAPILPAP